jgi:DNA-binding NarL/FixJ family response regulator
LHHARSRRTLPRQTVRKRQRPQITRRLIAEFSRSQRPTALPDQLDALTRREIDVLKLVARGLTNTEIARELYVAETTVRTHLGHILTKPGLRDRMQAVVLAYETGLVQPGAP